MATPYTKELVSQLESSVAFLEHQLGKEQTDAGREQVAKELRQAKASLLGARLAMQP